MKIEVHCECPRGGEGAVERLSIETGLSRQAIKRAMSKGAVWLGRDGGARRLRRADSQLRAGDQLHLYYDESVLEQTPAPATLIADEHEFSIWCKPAGLFSQGSKWGDHCTLGRWAETRLKPQRPAFAIHRLDRAATGLMVIAHAKGVAAAFATLFRQRRIDKGYLASVHGRWRTAQTLETPVDGKPATSHVTLLDYDESQDRSRVSVVIETGRRHQIRRQLSEAGHPVVGDRLYGGEDSIGRRELCLAAVRLGFISPIDGKRHDYRLPEDLLPCQ